MKSSQLILGFLALCAALFLAGIGWKLSHRAGTATPAPVTVAAQKNAPAPVAAPAAPATTVNPVQPVRDALKAGVLNPVFYVQTKMKQMQVGLVAALNKRDITLDDLDKLDFSPSAGTDPYNVFNPRGKINYTPLDGKWIDQDTIDRMTTKKGTPLVYNLRRVPDSGGVNEVLYAMIPNATPASCGVAAGNKDYTVGDSITIEPDNHTIVDDAPGTPIVDVGCLHTPDRKIVWLYKLKTRYKRTGGTSWGSR